MMWERNSLEPEVISYSTTRMFRIKRVGETYFVEHQQFEDDWKIVAKSTPDPKHQSGRLPAFAWLAKANQALIEHVRAERQKNMHRAALPNGSTAREVGDGHA